MGDYELDAWLGDTEVTAEQRRALHAASDAIDARYPDADLSDDRERALSAAAMLILGDATLEEVASQWQQACRMTSERHAALTGALIASPIIAPESEVSLARRAGVTRMTVRNALGKR